MEDGRRLTKSQLEYFSLYMNSAGRESAVTALSVKRNVSRQAVLKGYAGLIEKGILDEERNLTEYGMEYWAWYNMRRRILTDWYTEHGVPEEDAKAAADLLLALAPLSVIDMMTDKCLACSMCQKNDLGVMGKHLLQGVELGDYLPEGNYPVYFEFCRLDDESRLSMADDAFEKPGLLSVGEKGSELILKRIRISHMSMLSKREMIGKMRTAEYTVNNRRKQTKIDGDLIRISAKDIIWDLTKGDGLVQGKLQMAFTCTAGKHMPKAEAVMHIHLVKENGPDRPSR
ncbi:MAG: hypothetical protein Q4C73_08190 [Eubacteriales bacterium]|nr:hypothetical protein [Eubacteriales bacterium]